MSKLSATDRPAFKGIRPQYSLRTLLVWIAVLCALFAVLAQLPTVWAVMAVWFLILIAGHVVGNALGTRLRDGGTLGETAGADEKPTDLPPPDPARDRLPRPRATRLQERTPLGRLMFTIAAVGACLGGSLGGNAAAFATGDSMTMAGLAVATVSSAVIGGLFGFLAASFLSVMTTTILQGMSAENC
jgi:hypothetical protein